MYDGDRKVRSSSTTSCSVVTCTELHSESSGPILACPACPGCDNKCCCGKCLPITSCQPCHDLSLKFHAKTSQTDLSLTAPKIRGKDADYIPYHARKVLTGTTRIS